MKLNREEEIEKAKLSVIFNHFTCGDKLQHITTTEQNRMKLTLSVCLENKQKTADTVNKDVNKRAAILWQNIENCLIVLNCVLIAFYCGANLCK